MAQDLHGDVVGEFIADLNEFRESNGGPSLRQISALADRLGDLYGSRYRSLAPLSATALSDILGGRRKGLPSWERVAAIVLSCQRYAYETGALTADPGPDALLPRWSSRRSAAVRALAAGPPDEPPPPAALPEPAAFPEPADNDEPAEPVGPAARAEPAEVNSAGGEAALEFLRKLGLSRLQSYLPDPPAPRLRPPPQRERRGRLHVDAESLTARRYRALFGGHAVELLAAAEDQDDPDAAGRLGVLLICGECPREAAVWMERAVRGGDVMAKAIMNADPAYRRGLAVEFAYEFALQEGNRPWEIIPDPNTPAEVYGKVAARCGHPGAAFWLAARHGARGDQAGAAHWFDRAARRGHHYARDKFDEIHQQIWARVNVPGRPITVAELTGEWSSEPPANPPHHPG